MSEAPLDVANRLVTRDPERLWGVSPESLVVTASAIATGDPLEEALNPLYTVAVVESNDDRPLETVAEAHRTLLEELGVISEGEDTLTDLGRLIVTTDEPTPQNAIRSAAVGRLDRFATILRELYLLEKDTATRHDIEAMLRDEYEKVVLVPLIGSLGFATVRPQGAYLDRAAIGRVLDERDVEISQKALRAVMIVEATTGEDKRTAVDIAEQLIDEPIDQQAIPDDQTVAVAEVARAEQKTIPLEDVRVAVRQHLEQQDKAVDRYQNLLHTASQDASQSPNVETSISRTEVESHLSDREPIVSQTVIEVVAARAKETLPEEVDLGFLTDRTGFSEHNLFTTLESLPGTTVRMSGSETLQITDVPDIESEQEIGEEYTEYLLKRYHQAVSERERLRSQKVGLIPHRTDNIIADALRRVSDDVVAPVYFAYTLPDPKALGEEKMDKYVGDCIPLKEERVKLQEWAKSRKDDLKRFKTLTDRLFAKGLESDLDEQVLRIMTPYDDDTFEEYASQIRSLLQTGYEIRLITRHTKDPWEWERLRNNLLGDLDENRDKITIRTYSRYKKYVNVAALDDEPDGEFGIHAKLQTIGHAAEGVALVGSANFMENSYNWNPECGMYTENENFVQSAIQFFDHVWELSATDEVDLDRLPDIPNRTLYPSYYS